MPIIVLLAQCVAMFVASILCGNLPLMFKSAGSGKRLKAISVFGMGILVGAALTIIIPEGIATLYDAIPTRPAGGDDHDNSATQTIGMSLLSGFALMLLIESLTPHPPHSPASSPSSTPPTPSTPLVSSPRSSSEHQRPPNFHQDSRTPIIPKRLHMHDPENGGPRPKGKNSVAGLNATLGLVIHGAADGIALGASSLSGKGNLGLVVFLAVLVHKGPTALGLTTTLLSLGLDHPGIRHRLLIFSCAAPLGAVVSYGVVKLFGFHNIGVGGLAAEVNGLGWWTGIALLFSGGSFLYVATVIQPLSSESPDQHSHSHHANAESGDERDPPLGQYTRTALICAGMILPVMLSWVVGDHH